MPCLIQDWHARFLDLLIRWPQQEPKDCCPDVAVVFGLRNKAKNRERFIVETETVRPTFVLDVVSPRYRKPDRENKVTLYAQAQMQEYAIVDRRRDRGHILEEVLGYRSIQGHYEPITPDEEGRVRFETIGLWISLRDGQLVLEDIETGECLKTACELNVELAQANQRIDARLNWKQC